MQWTDIITGLPTLALGDTTQANITGVAYDSRAVIEGTLFVAMRGDTTDGNRYVRAALDAGAAAIVTDSRESFAFADARNVPAALIENGRRALAIVSANFFAHPEQSLKLTAVTGTNGKTTVAFLTEGLLRAAQRKTVLIGTIETHIVDQIIASPHTTPESRDILAIFAEGVAAGATEAIMEMSSHALAQERVWAIPVDTAIFTNLTQDHLDFHGTMDAYAAAKARLFQGLGAPAARVAIINADDPYTPQMQQAAQHCNTVWTYSLLERTADFYAWDIEYRAGETSFMLGTPEGITAITTNLTGRVNVHNLLAAFAAALARGIPFHQLIEAAQQLQPVPGRFETVPNSLNLTVVVDYAHTDDALRNLLAIARELVPNNCRVITVFGCGGDRDKTKRPRMGRAAAENSDLVILTSDNPRSEDPATIANQALEGILEVATTPFQVILDRTTAITQAIHQAQAGDIVLIAGKGHEKTQTIQGIATPFDDVAVAAAALRLAEGK